MCVELRVFSSLALGMLLAALARPQSPGGTYTLAVDRDKPIAITSLVFGDPGVNAFGTAPEGPSQVTVTTATGISALAAVLRACATGDRIGKVTATYTNPEGRVEYTIEFRKVSIVSVSLPGVSRMEKTLDDLAWTLTAADEKFDYRVMNDSGSGISGGNRKRLERARDRVKMLLWQQVRRTPWHTPPTKLAAPPGGSFSLELEGVNTGGVLAVGPLSVESRKSSRETSGFAPLTLTVEAARGVDFSTAIKRGAHLVSGRLTYYRVDADGKPTEIRISLKTITLKSAQTPQESLPKSSIEVTLGFDGLDASVTH